MDTNENPNQAPENHPDRKADPGRFAANRAHKSSMFERLFEEPKNFLELYNAIKDTNYTEDTPMKNTTLPGALTLDQLNDVSYLIDETLVAFFEHQSTVNRNMPLRMLMYVGRVFERLYRSDDIYKDQAIKIADAEFYVLYNGTQDLPPRTTLKLSDMRDPSRKNIEPKLELTVDIYNINTSKCPELLKKCRTLSEYETFVEFINKYRAETGNLHDAIDMTIAECKKRKILTEFIQKYASEIENMIFTQWNFEEAKAVWREEGREEERDEVLALVEQGYSVDEIRKMRAEKAQTARR